MTEPPDPPASAAGAGAEATALPQLQPPGLTRIVVRLTGVNLVVAALSFVTGPIQAQVLGPAGRGEVAAVITTLAIATWILDFGLTLFVTRERARGTREAVVYGTAVPLGCAFALLGVAAALPLSQLLGQGRHDVERYLAIGLLLSPLSVAVFTLTGAAWGAERWRLMAGLRLAPALLTAIALTILAATEQLTVASAIVSIIAAGLLGGLLVVPSVLRAGRWQFDRVLAQAALRFGSRHWISNLAVVGNLRLDQLLMAGLASSRQLGLYAVATTIASFSSLFVSALVLALYPRAAQDAGALLVQRASRVSLVLVLLAALLIGAGAPIGLPLLFGQAFGDAVPMTLVLLAASVPITLTTILTASLTAAGQPGATIGPQVAGLALAVPALVLLLPSTGGLGAAVIALLTGLVSAVLMVRAAERVLGGAPRDYVVATRDDLAGLRVRLRGARL